MEAVARKNIPPAHLGYLNTGVDSDNTLRPIGTGTRFQIKRKLVDVSETVRGSTSSALAGSSPIFLCPVGSQEAYHPEAELGTARAAAKGHHMVWPTQSSTAVRRLRKRKVRPSGTSSTRLTAGLTRLHAAARWGRRMHSGVFDH